MNSRTLDELLTEGAWVNCQHCQGHSLPGREQGQPGYCSSCRGMGEIWKSDYALLTDAQRVEVLEQEVLRLRPDLAQQYGHPKKP